jgi:hypothetical protein
MWREHRECSQEKRARNREFSKGLLTQCGIPFESKNGGAHLIVTRSGVPWADFWPGTGKWIERATRDNPQPAPKRGVRQLIERWQRTAEVTP